MNERGLTFNEYMAGIERPRTAPQVLAEQDAAKQAVLNAARHIINRVDVYTPGKDRQEETAKRMEAIKQASKQATTAGEYCDAVRYMLADGAREAAIGSQLRIRPAYADFEDFEPEPEVYKPGIEVQRLRLVIEGLAGGKPLWFKDPAKGDVVSGHQWSGTDWVKLQLVEPSPEIDRIWDAVQAFGSGR